MERDTTQAPVGQTPSDTFLQNQGTGTPQDTAGYSGIERDTTGQAGLIRRTESDRHVRRDRPGYVRHERPPGYYGAAGADTSSTNQSSNPNSGSQLDSTGTSQTGDTTGYNPSAVAGLDQPVTDRSREVEGRGLGSGAQQRPPNFFYAYFSNALAIVCSCMLLVPS